MADCSFGSCVNLQAPKFSFPYIWPILPLETKFLHPYRKKAKLGSIADCIHMYSAYHQHRRHSYHCAFRMTLGESKDGLHLVEQVHFIRTLSISSTILGYLFQQPLRNVFTSTQRCPLRTHNGLQPGQQT